MAKNLFLFFLILTSLRLSAAEEKKIYKAGYFETGPYSAYTDTFNALKKALKKQQWWDKLFFPDDARFSPGREKTTLEWENAARKVLAKKDLDIIFVLGTEANKAVTKINKELIQAGKQPPHIFGMSVTDAVKSGIVASEEDSGMKNYTVHIDPPGAHEHLFKIFYGEVGFQRLGLLYRNGNDSATLLEDAYIVAGNRGFGILEEKLEREDIKSCLQGIEHLIEQKMDAFFIPSLDCFDWQKGDVQKIFKLLMDRKIPTFSRRGSSEVKIGALMGFSSRGNFTELGETLATRLIKILDEGIAPGLIPMILDSPPQMVLNLYVANKLGFQPSFEILGACEEIYEEIILPEKPLAE